MNRGSLFSRVIRGLKAAFRYTVRFFAEIKDGERGENDPRFRDLYREFRERDLSVIDSFYNSLYICVQERMIRSKKTEKLFELSDSPHPLGWDEKNVVQRYSSFWQLSHRFLTKMPYWVTKPFALLKSKRAKRKSRRENILQHFLGRVNWIRRHLGILVPLVMAVGVFWYIGSVAGAEIVIGAEVDGKKLGLIENMDVLNSAVDDAERKASNALGRSFRFPYPIRYYFSYKEGFLTQTELYTRLIGCLGEYITPGYGLYVDGKLVAALKSEEEINRALSELVAEEQARQKPNYTVKLHNGTRIAQETFPTARITDWVHLKELLLYGSSDYSTLSVLDQIHENRYLVCSQLGLHFTAPMGEDAYERARIAAETVDFSNTYHYYDNQEDKNEESLEDVLPVVFRYAQRISTVGDLPFAVERVEDSTLYVGGEEVKVKGELGKGILTTEYTYVSGKLVDTKVVGTQIFKSPVTQVIRVGAKPLPEDNVSDSLKIFIMPKQGRLNSGFGWRDMNGDGRNDDLHTGIDIEAPMRSNIYASLSGTVVFAESYSTWGNLIRIRHDNGYETYYAHLDQFLVKVGDRVKQGQLIGLSGNTGYTTGPHFHFEIRKPNGDAVNPMNYMYKE